MSHMVIFQTPDGNPGYNQFETLAEAVSFIETLRNEQRVTNARMFALEEVKFEFKPYYRVEVQELTSGTQTTTSSTAPAPAPAEPAAAPQVEPAVTAVAENEEVREVVEERADSTEWVNGVTVTSDAAPAPAAVEEPPAPVAEPASVAAPFATESAPSGSFGDPVAHEPTTMVPPPPPEPPVRRGLFGR